MTLTDEPTNTIKDKDNVIEFQNMENNGDLNEIVKNSYDKDCLEERNERIKEENLLQNPIHKSTFSEQLISSNKPFIKNKNGEEENITFDKNTGYYSENILKLSSNKQENENK